MEKNVIRLSKYARNVGVVGTALFFLVTVIAALAGEPIPALCFFLIATPCVYLIIVYNKQMIFIEEDQLTFCYVLKKTRQVKYRDIRCVLVVPFNNNKTECVLLDREYNRLLVLEESLSNIEMLWDAFAEKNIPLVDFGRLVEEKKDVSPYLNALGRIEKDYYRSMLSEIETVENLSEEETGIDITKTRRKMRWLAVILLLADVAAFILEAKPMACIASLVLLVPYGVYIHYYPHIYVENKIEQGQAKMIKLPISGPVFAIFLLIGYLEYFNYNFWTFLMMTSVFAAILYVPYMIKSKKTELPQSAGRKASVFLAAFAISFLIMIPMNFVLTFDKPTHEMVYVTDKRISTSRHGSDYMLSVDLNGEEVEFDVSRKLYDKTDIGAVRVVCTKRSIIGFQYSSLHA